MRKRQESEPSRHAVTSRRHVTQFTKQRDKKFHMTNSSKVYGYNYKGDSLSKDLSVIGAFCGSINQGEICINFKK